MYNFQDLNKRQKLTNQVQNVEKKRQKKNCYFFFFQTNQNQTSSYKQKKNNQDTVNRFLVFIPERTNVCFSPQLTSVNVVKLYAFFKSDKFN